jgi:hypothetical protein
MSHVNLGEIFELILDWSEVWAILIPLFVLLFIQKKQPAFVRPIIVYLWLALAMNLLADVIGDFKRFLPDWLQSNNPLYNMHSIVRFACLSYFFINFKKSSPTNFKKIIPVVYALFIIINYSFFESFFNQRILSGGLFAVEAYLLLIYSMDYYLAQLRHDVQSFSSGKDFWIVTGLSIYVVVNFFLFLFYVPMIKENPALAGRMWNVHNVAYIIFCILIAKAFYVPTSN